MITACRASYSSALTSSRPHSSTSSFPRWPACRLRRSTASSRPASQPANPSHTTDGSGKRIARTRISSGLGVKPNSEGRTRKRRQSSSRREWEGGCYVRQELMIYDTLQDICTVKLRMVWILTIVTGIDHIQPCRCASECYYGLGDPWIGVKVNNTYRSAEAPTGVFPM